MDAFDDELREIKREIIESRGLVIKTNNLTNALSADLKSIAKRQQGAERQLVVTSATAYVIFVIVVLLGLKLAWDARVDAVRAETEESRKTAERTSRELKDAQKREEERARGESRAAAFWELVRQGKRNDALEQWDAIRKEPITKTEAAIFADAVDRFRGELSVAAFAQGLDHARSGRWHECSAALEESLRYKDDAAHSPSARYHLADAYRHLGRQRDAITTLVPLSEAASDKEILDDATWLLAQCQLDIQAWNDAKNTLRAFVRRFPDSPLVNDVKMALAEVSLKH